MDLILIFGPMKSGKSLELIHHFAPLKYTNLSYALYQPSENTRDENIRSRDGVIIEAKKVADLSEVLERPYDIVGVDEVHMFNEKDAEIIEELLKRGTKVIVSGLYADYRGRMFDIVRRLFELGPRHVTFKRAVCEVCKKPEAVYTQVSDEYGPILGGLPPSIVEDGTYVYKPVCRNCFVKE